MYLISISSSYDLIDLGKYGSFFSLQNGGFIVSKDMKPYEHQNFTLQTIGLHFITILL